MGTEIKLKSSRWKSETLGGDLSKHWVGCDIIEDIHVGYHKVLVLTETPEAYHEGFRITRKFRNKYLIQAQESYTVSTWKEIVYSLDYIIEAGEAGNMFNE